MANAVTAGAAPGHAPDVIQQEPEREERVRALLTRTWEIVAVPVRGPLKIDGVLDDPAWDEATPVTDFYQTQAREGVPGTERTEVRVLYDAANLYVGVRCHDTEPDRIKALAIFRDENSGDDLILVAIDAFHDHRSAVHFITNANGQMVDTLQTGETSATRNQNWDTIWVARGRRAPSGWEAELAIPFKSLRFPRVAPGEERIFGIGFKRNLPRKNEEDTWPFVSNDSTWYRPAELGHLRGIRDIEPGRNLEIRPYALGGTLREAGLVTSRRDAGVDVKWGVTSDLTADFTLRTDFAQEEADLQQLNFTRFSLFFPEKRQFFLEGQQMFQFGVPQEADLMFTRRIGLSKDGQIIPILGGARLSGRHGRTTIGLMGIQTDRTSGRPPENLGVVRLRRDFLSRSSVGALFTSRAGGGSFNGVIGADARLLVRRVWNLEGFLARMIDSTAASGTSAAFGRFAYESDRAAVTYRFLDIDPTFDPGLGFIRRADSRENSGEVRYSPRPVARWLRQMHVRGSLRYITNQRNVLETRERGVGFTFALESGDTITVRRADRLEFLALPFRLRRDIVISSGTYRFGTTTAELHTFRRRQARLNVVYSTGGFWNGTRDTLSLDTYYRMTKHFGVAGTYDVNWLALPQRRFTTHLISSRIEVAFRADVVLLPLLQYNSDTRQFSVNLRFHWITKPGSDFFIVYNELDDWSRLAPLRNRSLVVKLNYRFAF